MQGWAELVSSGVRTVIDLRETSEQGRDRAPRPERLTSLHIPLYDERDEAFLAVWGNGLVSTPLYYWPYIQTFPDRIVNVVSALAGAPPGGVVIHCRLGRDRTGLVIATLLSLLDVHEAEILEDYAFSDICLQPLFAAHGEANITQLAETVLSNHGRAAPELLRDLLAIDMSEHLRSAGLSSTELQLLRHRLLLV